MWLSNFSIKRWLPWIGLAFQTPRPTMNFNFNNVGAMYSDRWETPFKAKFVFANGKLETFSILSSASSASVTKRGATRATFIPTLVGANLEIVSNVGANLRVFTTPMLTASGQVFIDGSVRYARLNYELTPLNRDQSHHSIGERDN